MQAEHGRALRRHRRKPRSSAGKIREAIAFKVYEFDAHGVEMNQRYSSDAIVTDGQPEPAFEQGPRTALPADDLARRARCRMSGSSTSERHGKASTLDLAGHGRFTLLHRHRRRGLGRGGATASASELGIDIAAHVIGPRQEWQDLTGDWASAREVRDTGIVLVRPDQHVCWRRETIADDPAGELRRVLQHDSGQVRQTMDAHEKGYLHRGEFRRGRHRPQRERQGRAAESR